MKTKEFDSGKFTEAFREYRASQSTVTNQEITAKTGVSRSTLWRIQHEDEPKPNNVTILALCRWMRQPASNYYKKKR